VNEESLKKEFIPKFIEKGETEFYKLLIAYSLNKMSLKESKNFISPEIELLDYHNAFMSLYRKEGDDNFLKIAKVFRKAAHKIYRVLLKNSIINKSNKFLNLVA